MANAGRGKTRRDTKRRGQVFQRDGLALKRSRLDLFVEKLKTMFGIETLMLGGGGVLNWSFIQAGMCDEVSVVVAASADGSTDTPALFSARLADNKPVGFRLQSAEVKDGGCVWLRYPTSF